MIIKQEYLDKYLKDMAIDQIADEYLAKGFRISKRTKIKANESILYPDIIARKLNQRIFIIVQTKVFNDEEKENLGKISDYVRNIKDFKFILAFVSPVIQKEISVENIEVILSDYISSSDEINDSFNNISNGASVEELNDVDLDSIYILNNSINVKGTATISVELYFGPSRDGLTVPFNFPLKFDIDLELSESEEKFEITASNRMEVDISSFLE